MQKYKILSKKLIGLERVELEVIEWQSAQSGDDVKMM